MESEIRLIAFDVDGTLYSRASLMWRMFLSAFPNILLALAYQKARRQFREEQASVATIPQDRTGYLHRLCQLMLLQKKKGETPRNRERIKKAVQRQFYDKWKRIYRNVRPRAGLREAFEMVKQKGYRIAVLSDFPIEEKLRTLDIADLVDVALCSEDCGYLKPDSRAFSYLLEEVGLPANQVLYVGDSYQKDILGCQKMGMHSCLLSPRAKTYPKNEYVVRSFKEFISLLA
ncbi:MAG: HAD family hydrolase [Sphaerochaetaceae bacterium]